MSFLAGLEEFKSAPTRFINLSDFDISTYQGPLNVKVVKMNRNKKPIDMISISGTQNEIESFQNNTGVTFQHDVTYFK